MKTIVVPCTLLSKMPPSPLPEASDGSAGKIALIRSLRDEQRSARRWQDLLSPEDRRLLLADIARVALAIGQDLYPLQNPGDLDIGISSAGGDVCPRERLAFLALIWPRFSHALQTIEAAPATAVTKGTREARIEQGSLKRVSQSALLASIRLGDFIPAPESAGPLARRLRGRLPRYITETVASASYDIPVNRAVKAILVQVVRDLTRIIALSEISDASDIAHQAEKLRSAVKERLHQEPWRHLPPAPIQSVYPPAPGAAYRYIFDQWRRYRGSFAFDWTTPLFTLPPRDTWLLYEYSCLFAVARVLRDLGFRAASADGFALSRSGLTFSLEKGRASRLVFRRQGEATVTLRYNPDFSGKGTRRTDNWHSRSHSLRPDITVEAGGRLLIFDAKFKTYAERSSGEGEGAIRYFRPGALLPDIQQMHTYRDAISFGERDDAVSEAWLLYAGLISAPNPDIVAYPPSTEAEPFGSGGVGAFLLRPGREPKPLREFLKRFLAQQEG